MNPLKWIRKKKIEFGVWLFTKAYERILANSLKDIPIVEEKEEHKDEKEV